LHVNAFVVEAVTDTMHVCGCYSKAFDIDMSPLSFGADHLYHFITERFEGTSSPVQEQCLQWLQVYTAFRLASCGIILQINMFIC